jgi:N-acetylmuramoyl-L-alanine amidase
MKISFKTLNTCYVLAILLVFCSPTWGNNILGIRVGNHETHTRIVLDTQNKPNFKIALANKNSELRLFAPRLQFKARTPALSKTIVKNIAFNTFRTGVGEFIFQTLKPIKIIQSFTIPPSGNVSHYRYVIDIQPATSYALQKPAPTKLVAAPTKKIIVIDPGHGGKDPGATGRKGILEKNVTLSVANVLKEVLEKTNRYEVHLTRTSDCFLTLAKRVTRAREAKADFFISLHADSHSRTDTRGLSVYMLSRVASDSEAEKLAIKENKADLMDGVALDTESPEVANILIDLMKRETMNLSRKAANAVVAKLRKRVLLLRNSIRSANFAVLRTPDLPAVLVEMGYISNKQDEKLLTSPDHQIKLCEGIREGIDHYFNEHK